MLEQEIYPLPVVNPELPAPQMGSFFSIFQVMVGSDL